MRVEIQDWLSETNHSAAYVVVQKDADDVVIKSTLVNTLEEAKKLQSEWNKQLIVI